MILIVHTRHFHLPKLINRLYKRRPVTMLLPSYVYSLLYSLSAPRHPPLPESFLVRLLCKSSAIYAGIYNDSSQFIEAPHPTSQLVQPFYPTKTPAVHLTFPTPLSCHIYNPHRPFPIPTYHLSGPNLSPSATFLYAQAFQSQPSLKTLVPHQPQSPIQPG